MQSPRESGRSSIPETAVMESIGRGVLDPRMRGDDDREWSGSVHQALEVAPGDLLLIYPRLIMIRSALILV
jgi:hypothetical protein